MMLNNLLRRVAVGLVPAALVLAGCAEDIKTYTPTADLVQAVFDPSATPPAIPTPTDLAKDQVTGLLKVPVADAAVNPAQNYLDTFLNTLNGFPTSATAEVRFSGELDKSTVTKDTILVFDLSDPTKPAKVDNLVYEYKAYDATTKTSMVRVWNYAGWKRATNYVFFALSGDKGIKDPRGNAIIRSALFELASGAKPLCAWDSTRSWNTKTRSCEPAAGTSKGAGCCTFNYSALVESSVKRAVRCAAPSPAPALLCDPNVIKPNPAFDGMDAEAVEAEVKIQVLSKATDFERLRQGYNLLLPIAEAAGLKRDDVAVLWNFTTIGMNEAVFDPASSTPRIPKPTDLIRDPKTGLLAVPLAPTAGDAEKAFTAYLNSLDGYPPSSGAATALEFTADLESTSAKNAFLVLEIVGGVPTPITDVTATWDPAGKRVVVTRTGGFGKRGATYAVFALAGANGLKNASTALAPAPKRSALMHLVLSPKPLCTVDATTKACTDVKVSSFIDDPADKPGKLTALEKSTKFETIRQGYDGVLKGLEATGKAKREDVIALWTFSIVSMTEVMFDTTAGVIPFPNDLLMDQAGLVKTPPEYKVAIPAQPGETATEKVLRERLNTLDGFTTQGPSFAAVTGAVDPASVQFGVSVLAFNIDKQLPEPMKFEFLATGPAIVATPTRPLDEKTRYAIILMSKLKEGSPAPDGSGLKDAKGRRVVPALTTALLRSKAKLFENGKSTVSLLSDAQAQQAEPLRANLQALFDGLEANPLLPIKRQDIVGIWTFRTQTTTEKMPQIRALPWSILGVADANQPKWIGAYDATLAGFPTNVPSTDIAGWVKSGRFVSWNAIDEAGGGTFLTDPTKGKGEPVPFLMTIPKGTMPPAGWPVAIYQHGIFDVKEDGLAVANSLASKGIAMISFDVMYHGERTWCTADKQCAAGTCTIATGKCSTSLIIDPTTFPVPGPAASGARFMWTDNPAFPFALLSNFYQYVVDGAALLRGIAVVGLGAPGAWTGLTGFTGQKLDPKNVSFVGMSIGSILGAPLLAADPLPTRVDLNVVGAPFVTIARTGATYKPLFDGLLASFKVTDGSLAALKLINILYWILDPVDAGNYAPYLTTKQLPDLVASKVVPGTLVPKKAVICQLATNDQTVPKSPNGDYFAAAAGVDTTKTTFTGQGHGFLLKGTPDQKATEAAQAQMSYFFDPLITPRPTDKTVCTPNLTAGICP